MRDILPSTIIRDKEIGPKDLILLALVGCGGKPGPPVRDGIHRMYLMTYINYHRVNSGRNPHTEEALQSPLEKERELWRGRKGSGYYALTQAGSQTVRDVWGRRYGNLVAEHRFSGLAFRATLSVMLRGSHVRVNYDGAKGHTNIQGVKFDDVYLDHATWALDNLGILRQDWQSSNGASHLYNLVFQEGEQIRVDWHAEE